LKKALALSALPLALLFGAAFQSSVPAQLEAILSEISGLKAQVASLANKGPRKFYLTPTTHTGAQALSACARGYHMASLWEIHDPTNLRYDTELGVTRADSGFGPPTGIGGFGWIRTGYFAESAGHSVGTVNCNAWTSADSLADGTAITLPSFWGSTTVVIGPWFAAPSPCNAQLSVWCVQD
jgi:hypothetical protein